MDSTSFLWGAAIGVIGAFGTGFLKKAGEDCYSWARKKINPKAESQQPHQLVIHVSSDSAPSALEPSTGSNSQHPIVERLSAITLGDITASIAEAPPLQRDRVAESYLGFRIEWEALFVGGQVNDDGNIRLHLRVPEAKHQPKSVWCDVPASEYRELGILQEDAKVRISGEIEKVTSWGVHIKDARLHIYDLHRGA